MKKIVILAVTGIFLALIVLVVQDRESRRLQMEGLFKSSVKVVNADIKETGAPAVEQKSVVTKAPENTERVQAKSAESVSALRNEEIKRALKIKPREASREEIKKVLARYRKEGKIDKGYRQGNDAYSKSTSEGWSGKRYNHEEEDDDD